MNKVLGHYQNANRHVIRVMFRRRGEKGVNKYLKEIMAKTFPNMIQDIYLQIQVTTLR